MGAVAKEWLWHVDDRDEPIGRVERDVAHAQGIRHRAGVVLLRDARGFVYVTRRAATKAIFPATYDTSASFHVSYGETYAAAAEREALEELGLSCGLRELGKFRHDDPPEHQFVGVFEMEHAGGSIRLDATEASGGAFHAPREVERIVREERCTPWLRDALAWILRA
jgi:isopentenyldiphosphate isomerase